MTLVATLIANPAAPQLEEAHLRRAAQELGAKNAPVWLDPGIAADLVFASAPAGNHRALARRVSEVLGSLPIDVVVQPVAGRRKRLLIADMDSTMIGQECIDELADFVGLKDKVSAITERAMRGEIAFEPALRERVALLRGLEADIVDKILAERITLTPGGRALVATMRANSAAAWLVSGGFTLFTEKIAAMIGFDLNRANRLVLEKGRLCGLVEEPILGKQAKLDALLDARARLGLAAGETLAVGDGANDLAMLSAAGLGVAFHAKPQVAAEAHAAIDHGDLTALLYMQGYRRTDFVQ